MGEWNEMKKNPLVFAETGARQNKRKNSRNNSRTKKSYYYYYEWDNEKPPRWERKIGWTNNK